MKPFGLKKTKPCYAGHKCWPHSNMELKNYERSFKKTSRQTEKKLINEEVKQIGL